MYVFIESVRSALASIRANRLRSFLTSLGIIIGVASVITVVSLIQCMSKSISDQFAGLGSNALTIRAKNDFKEVMRGKVNYIRFDDIEQLRLHVDGLGDLCPVFSPEGTTLRLAERSSFARVLATTPSFQDVHGRYARAGRFITDSDEQNARRVMVVGEKVVEDLHMVGNPIGQFVQFSNEWFKIVGVMEKRGEVFGMSQDDTVIIPYKTGRSIIGNNREPRITLNVSLDGTVEPDEVKRQLETALRKAHRLKEDEKNDFEITGSDQLAKSFAEITTMVTLVMGGIVGIALLVGGIGIMNIMLVSVTERTREIGICKAIGARSRDIMLQFLIEAVLLSVLGGLIGLAIGYGLGIGIASLIPNFPDAFVPWWAVALSLLFSGGVGIVFGVIPAAKAAKLDPIDALRYE
ncbi:ABC transporter permease [Massilia glaciei]|uniref:Multidrug ABC transporter substrate-binding protein n=1 Tax=Massilia glaciei TaxID=1524097 RepID=A0A2U2I4N2_9BURK|nr:ABC transporter permease [Massilia glaciei]PWF54778.1 multidrug ABC transporter substrate-binding protein [Massilia glaciei]